MDNNVDDDDDDDDGGHSEISSSKLESDSSDSGGDLSSNTDSDSESEKGDDNDNGDEDGHMDECFICDDGGELILCDGENCKKAYHAECVNADINTLPLMWYCPSCTTSSTSKPKKVDDDNATKKATPAEGVTKPMTNKTSQKGDTVSGSSKEKVKEASGLKKKGDHDNATKKATTAQRGTKPMTNKISQKGDTVSGSSKERVKEASGEAKKNTASSAMPTEGEASVNQVIPNKEKPVTTTTTATTTDSITAKDRPKPNDGATTTSSAKLGKSINAAACPPPANKDVTSRKRPLRPDGDRPLSDRDETVERVDVARTRTEGEVCENNLEKKGAPEKKRKKTAAAAKTKQNVAGAPTSVSTEPLQGARSRQSNAIESSLPPSSLPRNPVEQAVPAIHRGGTVPTRPLKPMARPAASIIPPPPEVQPTTFRTVTVPPDVAPGDVFHVLLGGGKNVIGVICPEGVYPGNTMIVLEPGEHAPVPPRTIAERNVQHLLRGFAPSQFNVVGNTFWKLLWPRLVGEGWAYTRQVHFNFGAMKFYTPGARSFVEAMRVRNVHYFESIGDITHFLSMDPKYAKIVEEFDAEIARRKKTAENEAGIARRKERAATTVQKKKKKRVNVEKVHDLDAWKYQSEREHSKVGSQHQVRTLPRAGTDESGESEKYIQDQIWDITSSTPCLTQSTWHDWAKDAQFADRFHRGILESKKQIHVLASSLDRPFAFCLWYYYHKYKPSRKYPILKKLMTNLKEQKHSDECAVCGEGGDLLCCETCTDSYHLTCIGVDPSKPEGVDVCHCPSCVRKRNLQLSSPKSPCQRRKGVLSPVDGSGQSPAQNNGSVAPTVDPSGRLGNAVPETPTVMAEGAREE